jgi:Vacuolar (H+)-ATPase G subunit
MRLSCAAKSDRLKQAKAEADKEIQAYKQDKENSFQQKVSAVRLASCYALDLQRVVHALHTAIG